ncbi:MAG TPA: hypothetical protein VNM40_02410 [Candidatus Paceibacterota bacterium]|nr:hypothetical protein [Candidatus Paceibacterota bacterium]
MVLKAILLHFLVMPVLFVPDSVWYEQQGQRMWREIQLSAQEPMLGEPASVSRLRKEMIEYRDQLIGPRLVFE